MQQEQIVAAVVSVQAAGDVKRRFVIDERDAKFDTANEKEKCRG